MLGVISGIPHLPILFSGLSAQVFFGEMWFPRTVVHKWVFSVDVSEKPRSPHLGPVRPGLALSSWVDSDLSLLAASVNHALLGFSEREFRL